MRIAVALILSYSLLKFNNLLQFQLQKFVSDSWILCIQIKFHKKIWLCTNVFRSVR